MYADSNVLFFSYRSHLLDEIRVVFPNLLCREYPAVRERLAKDLPGPCPLLVRARHIEFSGGRSPDFRSAAAPDAVAHMSIRRVVDSGLPQVAQIVLVLFNLLIPARQIERNLRHVMNTGAPDVPNRDAGIRITLLNLEEAFGSAQVRCGCDAHVFHTNLVEKEQIVVGGVGGELPAELDSRRVLMDGGLARCPGGEQSRRSERTAQNYLSEFSAL